MMLHVMRPANYPLKDLTLYVESKISIFSFSKSVNFSETNATENKLTTLAMRDINKTNPQTTTHLDKIQEKDEYESFQESQMESQWTERSSEDLVGVNTSSLTSSAPQLSFMRPSGGLSYQGRPTN